jgi:hypothetical protein
MKPTNIPGFSAEASLCKVSARFQARIGTQLHRGLAHPANLSSTTFTTPGLFCSTKLVCTFKNRWPWIECSYTGFGLWNPVTNRCE